MKPKKELNMKKLFRRNQVIITALAVMIAAAGYLNYAGKQELAAGSEVFEAGMLEISDEDILAENQASPNYGETLYEIGSLDQDVSDDGTIEEAMMENEAEPFADGTGEEGMAAAGDQVYAEAPEQGAQESGLENPGEAVLTSGMSVTDYIANVQLNREQIRAKNKDALMNLINSTGIEESAKQQAIQEMIDLTDIAERENATETLLMAKGFADPVVSVSSGQVDVVINAPNITDQQRAQIEDIVKRKTEVTADQIVISLMNLSE